MIRYYKYRATEVHKYFEDIFRNSRLYASPYTEFNDIDEGSYFYEEKTFDEVRIDNIRQNKMHRRILSLSSTWKNNRMWAYYSDSHRGCVLEVEPSLRPEPVTYVKSFPTINKLKDLDDGALADHILHCKLASWKHEEEYRVITINEPYVDVRIKTVIFGLRASADYIDQVKNLVAPASSTTFKKIWNDDFETILV